MIPEGFEQVLSEVRCYPKQRRGTYGTIRIAFGFGPPRASSFHSASIFSSALGTIPSPSIGTPTQLMPSDL